MRNRTLSKLTLSFVASVLVMTTGCEKSGDDDNWKILAKVSEDSSTTENVNPQAVTDSNGNVLVVWQQNAEQTLDNDTDGTNDTLCSNSNIRYRYYTASAESWSAEATLHASPGRRIAERRPVTTTLSDTTPTYLMQTTNSVLDTEIKLGVDGSGSAIAVWIQDSVSDCATSTNELKPMTYSASFSAASQTWSTATAFTETDDYAFMQSAKELQLAINADGKALAAWTQKERYGLTEAQSVVKGEFVYGASYDGTTWSSAKPLSDLRDADISTSGVQSVSAGTDNNHTTDTADDTAYATPLYHVSSQPHVAINADGDGIVVWKQSVCYTGTAATDCRALTQDELDSAQQRHLIRARRFDATAGFTALATDSVAVSNSTINSFVTQSATQCSAYDTDHPRVALDASNKAWIAWEQVTTTTARSGGVCATSRTTLRNVYLNTIGADNSVGTATAMQSNIAATAVIDESALSVTGFDIAAGPNDTALVAWIMTEPMDDLIADLQTSNGITVNNRWNYTSAQSLWHMFYDGSTWSAPTLVGERAWLETYRSGRGDVADLHIVRTAPLGEVNVTYANNGFTTLWQKWDDPRHGAGFQIMQARYQPANNTSAVGSAINASGSVGDYSVNNTGKLTIAWSQHYQSVTDSTTHDGDEWQVERTVNQHAEVDVAFTE